MTIFTLFCLLNAAGYDLENREAMHPVRIRMRADLDARMPPDLRARVRAYYNARRESADPWSYSVAAKATSGPPDFAPTSDWAEIRRSKPFASLDDLHDLLRELYARADVPALYAEVEAPYRDYARAYEAVTRREVGAVLAYCRVADIGSLSEAPAREQPNALVIPNLLDSHEHAFSFVLADRFISVEGPQVRAGPRAPRRGRRARARRRGNGIRRGVRGRVPRPRRIPALLDGREARSPQRPVGGHDAGVPVRLRSGAILLGRARPATSDPPTICGNSFPGCSRDWMPSPSCVAGARRRT